jgi:predicted transcriptional regulator
MRVIGYRVDHGLSQTGLARLLGMHQPAVARLEAGDHEPSLATLSRPARWFLKGGSDRYVLAEFEHVQAIAQASSGECAVEGVAALAEMCPAF